MIITLNPSPLYLTLGRGVIEIISIELFGGGWERVL